MDQGILGDKEFVDRVMKRSQKGIARSRRRHEFSLTEMVTGIGQLGGVG